MSKKSRRKRRQSNKRPRIDRGDRPSIEEKTHTSQASAVGRRSDFSPDYTYVRKDLKRIVQIAGSMIAILIALSFILR